MNSELSDFRDLKRRKLKLKMLVLFETPAGYAIFKVS
jgi:hypothetical protein